MASWDAPGADASWSDGRGPDGALGHSLVAPRLTRGIWAHASNTVLMWGTVPSNTEWRLSIYTSDGCQSHLPLSIHY